MKFHELSWPLSQINRLTMDIYRTRVAVYASKLDSLTPPEVFISFDDPHVPWAEVTKAITDAKVLIEAAKIVEGKR